MEEEEEEEMTAIVFFCFRFLVSLALILITKLSFTYIYSTYMDLTSFVGSFRIGVDCCGSAFVFVFWRRPRKSSTLMRLIALSSSSHT